MPNRVAQPRKPKWDFSRAAQQDTFNMTRQRLEIEWERAFDVETDVYQEKAHDSDNLHRFLLYSEAVIAVSAWLGDGNPGTEHRRKAEKLLEGTAGRGRPPAPKAERGGDLAFAAVYSRMIRNIWRRGGVIIDAAKQLRADEWACRMTLNETDLSQECSGACSDLMAKIPGTLNQSRARSYATTSIIDLERLRLATNE